LPPNRKKDNFRFKAKGVSIGLLGQKLLDAKIKGTEKALNNSRNNYQKETIERIKREIEQKEKMLNSFNKGECKFKETKSGPLGLQQELKELRQRLTDVKRGNF